MINEKGKMKGLGSRELSRLASQFFSQNYDYLWLKTMLKKGCATAIPGSTLITGSSHALNGIYERAWKNAVNCSMHSQDIYYDFQCAHRVLSSTGGHNFEKCFIVMGYYIAFQDLSRSKISRESMIARIYYPIFQAAHNWSEPVLHDPWASFGDVPKQAKEACERAAAKKILDSGTYYTDYRPRGTYFNLNGRSWSQVAEEERRAMGAYRAEEHNRLFQHKASLEENKEILREFVRFLYSYNVTPIVVITPFTEGYSRCVLREMKEGMLELLDSVPEDVHYVDFNEASSLFEPADFMDTDHLSAAGAKKMSTILADMFGDA